MITNIPKETDKYEAFDLVANAWEELDLYQRSSDVREPSDLYQRSADEAALENAIQFLDEALKQDPEYFKARYLTAICTYFTDPSDAAARFTSLLGENSVKSESRDQAGDSIGSDTNRKKPAQTKGHLEALNQEIRFNLAAASLEAIAGTVKSDEDVKNLREEFEKLRDETKKDSTLNLLARSAVALCKALIGKGTTTERRRIWWKLWLIELFPWRIELGKRKIRFRKIDIDSNTAAAIRKILRNVKNPKPWQELSPRKTTAPAR